MEVLHLEMLYQSLAVVLKIQNVLLFSLFAVLVVVLVLEIQIQEVEMSY